jgi:uncharacterized coiled-coil protein SlyX
MKKPWYWCCLLGSLCAGVFAQTPPTSNTQANALPERVQLSDLEGPLADGNKARSKPYLAELIKLREKEGRDNALIHYTVAGWPLNDKLLPGKNGLNDQLQDTMRKTMNQGWNAESGALLPFLEKYQPAFNEIRRGTALDYAKTPEDKLITRRFPTECMTTIQTTAQMLCVEGRYFENQGQYAKALDNYLTVMTLGRDLGGAEQPIIHSMLSIAFQNFTIQPLSDLLSGGHLTQPDLEKALARLKQIEKTGGTAGDMILGEGEYSKGTLTALNRMIKEAQETAQKTGKKPEELYPKIAKEIWGAEMPLTDLLPGIDKAPEQIEQMMKTLAKQADAPYSGRDFEKETDDILKEQSAMHVLAKGSPSNLYEVEVRFLIKQSKLRMAQIQTALELARLEKGLYPENLSDFTPKYFDKLPIDPFSDGSFLYVTALDRKSYTLMSIGPDKTRNPDTVSYDPTNGSRSEGDVFQGKK